MRLKDILSNPEIMKNLRFDLTPNEVLKPIGTKTETEIKEQAGFFFCIMVDNNRPKLFLVHMLPTGWGNPAYISDFPEDILRDAVRDADGDIKTGFFPINKPIEDMLRLVLMVARKEGLQ